MTLELYLTGHLDNFKRDRKLVTEGIVLIALNSFYSLNPDGLVQLLSYIGRGLIKKDIVLLHIPEI